MVTFEIYFTITGYGKTMSKYQAVSFTEAMVKHLERYPNNTINYVVNTKTGRKAILDIE